MKIQIQRPRSCCKVAWNSIVNQIICSPESDCSIILHPEPTTNSNIQPSENHLQHQQPLLLTCCAFRKPLNLHLKPVRTSFMRFYSVFSMINSCLSTATSTRSQTKHVQLCQHAKPVSMVPASAGSCSQLRSHPLLAAIPTSACSLWQPAAIDIQHQMKPAAITTQV